MMSRFILSLMLSLISCFIFSYKIRKHTIIKSQTNYQYNIIQKRWEWFFGVSIGFSF